MIYEVWFTNTRSKHRSSRLVRTFVDEKFEAREFCEGTHPESLGIDFDDFDVQVRIRKSDTHVEVYANNWDER